MTALALIRDAPAHGTGAIVTAEEAWRVLYPDDASIPARLEGFAPALRDSSALLAMAAHPGRRASVQKELEAAPAGNHRCSLRPT
jgi:hypothetical protein